MAHSGHELGEEVVLVAHGLHLRRVHEREGHDYQGEGGRVRDRDDTTAERGVEAGAE